jgi:methionyl-tRNA formyltransferase
MHGEERAGMMVQSLRDELDAGVVQAYSEIDLQDCDSWGAIRTKLYNQSTALLTDAVETIQSDDEEPMRVEEFGPVHNPPSAGEIVKFVANTVR